MSTIGEVLGSVVAELSDENYAKSLAFYHLWFDIGQTYLQVTSDHTFNSIFNKRGTSLIDPDSGKLIHPTAQLILRFADDVSAQPDSIPPPPTSELQNRLCTMTLREFFTTNLRVVWGGENYAAGFRADANLIAHWANLGYVEETAIHNHILQSLTSHPKLYDHQADALIILFKLAGATFGAYADPSVVDRCFELLQDHKYVNPHDSERWSHDGLRRANSYDLMKRELIQEVVTLRERCWEGLPLPPVPTAGILKPTAPNQNDPAATPVVTSLGLPNRDLEPQISPSPPPESVTIPDSDLVPASPAIPATQSPSISIATLSDFTIADTSDDESHIDPTSADASDDESRTDPVIAGTSDDGSPNDPTVITPHETFYLEDGNVEVLCGNTLFRVHTTILSFHSPALRRMFTQTKLTTAESPNCCPRIRSSDMFKDFATLLKIIYLPGFPERNKVPDFTTFSSLLRITEKYEMQTVRSQLLEVVRDAYPETFEGLGTSKPIGERVFRGSTPHPNEVLNLFVQQNLTSALPIAYYMAAQRGLDSLMDGRLPTSARLPPEILQVATRGLMTIREVELNETHRLIFGPKGSHPCSASNCPSRTPTGSVALEAYQKVFDYVVGSSRLGTNLLQVPEFYEDRGGDVQCVGPGICNSCVERWESGHAELRKKVWATLPDVFRLKG